MLMVHYINLGAKILSPRNIRELAYKLAKANNVKIPSQWE